MELKIWLFKINKRIINVLLEMLKIMKEKLFLLALVTLILGAGCVDSNKKENVSSTQKEKKALVAQHFYSGFPLAHDTYNTLSTASDGRVYYCLSSQSIDTGGQYYDYDPKYLHMYAKHAKDDGMYQAYLDQYIFGPQNHGALMDLVGKDQMARIAADPRTGYAADLDRS